MTLADRFFEHFPVVVGERRVEIVSVDVGDAVTVTASYTEMEGGQLVEMREQAFAIETGAPDQRPDRRALAPDEVDPAALAANVRHHLARVSFPMPFELFERPAVFRKLERYEEGIDLPDVGMPIFDRAREHGFELRYWAVDQWPEPARTLFFLGQIYAMVGGNGLEVYLHQNQPDEVMGALAALDRVGSHRLAHRYREALGLAAREHAEPLDYVDGAWLDKQALDPPASWREIDSHEENGTYWLIDHELRPAAIAFIAAHRDELFSLT